MANPGAFVAQFLMEIFSRENRAKRKAARKARRAAKRGELSSELIEAPEEGRERTMSGKLTYTGIAALMIAWGLERFGVPATSVEIEGVVTAVVAAVGAVAGIYGRWRATRKVVGGS